MCPRYDQTDFVRKVNRRAELDQLNELGIIPFRQNHLGNQEDFFGMIDRDIDRDIRACIEMMRNKHKTYINMYYMKMLIGSIFLMFGIIMRCMQG